MTVPLSAQPPLMDLRLSSASGPPAEAAGPLLHVGCGRERLAGWINLDAQDLPGVDVVADVTQGLSFEDCRAIFAEHFLEHLPNLEWILAAIYDRRFTAQGRLRSALEVNRGFYAWGHRFLWDRCLLEEALLSSPR